MTEVLKWRHLIRFSNIYGLALDIRRLKLTEKSSSQQFWTVGILDWPWMLIDGKLSIVDHSNLCRSYLHHLCQSSSPWRNILSGVPYQLCCIPFVLILLDCGNSILSGLPKFPNPAWILSDLQEIHCKERVKCLLLKFPDTCIQTDKLQLCGLCVMECSLSMSARGAGLNRVNTMWMCGEGYAQCWLPLLSLVHAVSFSTSCALITTTNEFSQTAELCVLPWI